MISLQRFFIDDSGQDMVEFGLLSAFISIAAIVTLKNIAPLIIAMYHWKTQIRSAM